MWIGVVLGIILVVIGSLSLVAVSALSADPEIASASAALPPMAVMWVLMLISAALVVAQLVLVIRIPRQQAATRTAIIWLFAISAAVNIVTAVLTTDYASNVVSLLLSALLIGLLMTDGAKRYFVR
jgi:drug/metabolite transporter (DMT)-like permease